MKRIMKTLVVIAAVQIVAMPYGNLFAVDGDMGNGSGTEGDPYLIEDFTDFTRFATDPNYWSSGVYTQLTTDLDLDPALPGRQVYTTAAIAPDTNDIAGGFQVIAFSGVFDGNDHEILNLTIDDGEAGNWYLGLFGDIYSGEVRNLGLQNISIKGGNFSCSLGGLCGLNDGGIIRNCYVTGSVSGGDGSYSLGGLCGGSGYGTIINCYSDGSVSGIDNSQALGGLCGVNGGPISDCYATGSVSGYERIAGLCGSNVDTITNCYSTCDVNGVVDVGGLLGFNYVHASISNCFWDTDTQTHGVTESIGDNQGTATNVHGFPPPNSTNNPPSPTGTSSTSGASARTRPILICGNT